MCLLSIAVCFWANTSWYGFVKKTNLQVHSMSYYNHKYYNVLFLYFFSYTLSGRHTYVWNLKVTNIFTKFSTKSWLNQLWLFLNLNRNWNHGSFCAQFSLLFLYSNFNLNERFFFIFIPDYLYIFINNSQSKSSLINPYHVFIF